MFFFFFLLLGMMYAALFGVMMKFSVPFFFGIHDIIRRKCNANAKKFLPSKIGSFSVFPLSKFYFVLFPWLGYLTIWW